MTLLKTDFYGSSFALLIRQTIFIVPANTIKAIVDEVLGIAELFGACLSSRALRCLSCHKPILEQLSRHNEPLISLPQRVTDQVCPTQLLSLLLEIDQKLLLLSIATNTTERYF